MKKWITLFCFLLLALLLNACGQSKENNGTNNSSNQPNATETDEYEEVTIRLAYNLPSDHHISLGIEEFAKKVQERSNGKVNIQLFPSGQLLTDKDMNQSILAGTVEMGVNSATLWASTVPEIGVLDLPYLFDDYSDVSKALEGEFGDILREAMEAKGAKILMFADYGYIQLANNVRPLKTPDDLKGLKIRSTGDIPSMVIEQFGGSPVFMGAGEVYTALQRGTIDGATSGTTAMLQRNYHEVAKYLTINNYSDLEFLLVANKKFWDKLPEKTQNLLLEVAKEQEEWIRNQAQSEDERTAQELEKLGMEVYRVPEEELQLWKEKSRPVIDKYIEQHGETAKKLINLLQQENS